MNNRNILLPGVLTAALVFLPTLAGAALTASQLKCADAMTKDLTKSLGASAKGFADCVKSHAKGTLSGDLAACPATDPKQLRATAAAKTAGDFAKRCAETEPGELPELPTFGAVSAPATTAAAQAASDAIITDIYGNAPDLGFATGDALKCQSAVLKAVNKCVGTRAKQFRGCAKDVLKSGADDAGALSDACLGIATAGQPDPKGTIAKLCGDSPTTNKILQAIEKKCVQPGVDLAVAFAGCAEASSADLHQCAAASAACNVCKAANESAGLTRDCDVLDDGEDNGSCPVCGNGIREGTEVCDGADDSTCPGECLTICACPGTQEFTTTGDQSQVTISGFGAEIVFPLEVALDLEVRDELVDGAVGFDVGVQALPPAVGSIGAIDQTLCVFFEQGAGLPAGVAGTGVINCSAADITGLTVLDSPKIQEYYDHCVGGLSTTCDSAPNDGGGKTDETTGVFVPDGPSDPGCDDPFFNPDVNSAHAGNCVFGPDETAGPGPFGRGDATLTVRAVFDLRGGVDDCSGGATPGSPEAVLEFTTGRAQTGIMDFNGNAGQVQSLIAFGAPFDCNAFLREGDPAGATFVGTFPVIDLELVPGFLADVLVEAVLVGG